MIGFTPTDVSSANTLLEIIADPKAAKAALDELAAAKADSEAAAEAARIAQEAALKVQSDASDKLAALADAILAHDGRVATDKETLDLRTAALDQREAGLRAAQSDLDEERKQHQQRVVADAATSDARKAELDEREQALAVVATEIVARSQSCDERETTLNRMITEYTNRLAKLGKIASGEDA